MAEKLGTDPNELTTKTLAEVFVPENSQTTQNLLNDPFKRSSSSDVLLRARDDSAQGSFVATITTTPRADESNRMIILQSQGTGNDLSGSTFDVESDRELQFLDSSFNELNFSSELLQKILDEIYVFEVETSRIVDVNETALERLGYTREEMIGTPIRELVLEYENLEQWENRIEQYRAGHPGVIEGHHIREDGSTYPVEANSTLHEYNGKEFLISVARDISKRREQERETQRLFNTVNEIITVHDPETHELIDINRTAEELLGYDKEELLEMGVEGYSVEEEGFTQEYVEETVLEFLKSPDEFEPIDWACWTKNGRKLWFEVNPAVMKWKGKERILTISREITQRRETRKKLQFRESLLKAQQESADEGILVVDPDRNILSYNDKFQELWEIPDEVLDERSDKSAIAYVLDKVENSEKFRETIENLYDRRDEKRSDVIHLKDGTILERYTSPVQDEENFYGRVWYFRDITEERTVKEQLERSLEEKETLLEEIHHRVKNNIQIIMSLLKMQMKNEDSGDLRESFQDSLNRLETMALIHEKLYQSEHLSEVDFPKYVEELSQRLIRSYARSENVDLLVEVDNIELDLETSISCGLIVNELVTNALEHGLSGDSGQIRVEINREEKGFRLIISDNGTGLPDGFDPDEADTIGLNIVRSLVEYDLDGSFQFDDSSHGLTVRINVPEEVVNS